MAIAILELQKALDAVAPTFGVSIGVPGDKRTWRVDFNNASKDQMAAAQSVIDGFTYADVPEVDPLVEVKARLSAVEAKVDSAATSPAEPTAKAP